MKLTNFTDFALRLLMYAAAHEDRLITIEEASEAYDISRAHLMKITNTLTRAGFLKAVRGRSGGLMLAKPPARFGLATWFAPRSPISRWSNASTPAVNALSRVAADCVASCTKGSMPSAASSTSTRSPT